MNRSLDIQPIQSTIFRSDKDMLTFESAVPNGQTSFGLIPISLCGVFFLVSGLILYVLDESKELTNMTEPD